MVERSSELNEANKDLEIEKQEENFVRDEMNKANNISEPEISDDPEELREQIEETRREMGETLDAIQEKLSFENISEQVKDQVSEQITGAVETLKTTVSDATVGKAGKFMKDIGQEIKKTGIVKLAGENPLPLALIGLGLGLLIFTGKKDSSDDYRQYRYKENFRETEVDDWHEKQLAEKSKAEKSSGISRTVGDAASSAYEGVSDAAGSTYQAVSDTAVKAYNKFGDLGGGLKRQYNSHLNENPLIIGAVALAVGAAVGFAIPLTDYEEKLMGETRDKLMSRAGVTARGAIDKVQDIAGQAKDTIVEEVKTQTTTK